MPLFRLSRGAWNDEFGTTTNHQVQTRSQRQPSNSNIHSDNVVHNSAYYAQPSFPIPNPAYESTGSGGSIPPTNTRPSGPMPMPVSHGSGSSSLNAAGPGGAANNTSSSTSTSIQLTRDADLLIQTYLPHFTEAQGSATHAMGDKNRYLSPEEEKERLRREYQRQDSMNKSGEYSSTSGSSMSASFPTPSGSGSG
ncbi:hypothetical protein K435DRAFT_870492 [Dendrothele bispora CBS 962.96]|uniref:Uncharacterized protein n=1 Tax=Dendrothele bispora (strain CBS 962.96) TaxID=1314807 RepID=A0A4S8L6W0_DENBC|nr:hypothetical protein K435DRAFT_870492 [Dendrothele bispora CBS 962.96]